MPACVFAGRWVVALEAAPEPEAKVVGVSVVRNQGAGKTVKSGKRRFCVGDLEREPEWAVAGWWNYSVAVVANHTVNLPTLLLVDLLSPLPCTTCESFGSAYASIPTRTNSDGSVPGYRLSSVDNPLLLLSIICCSPTMAR